MAISLTHPLNLAVQAAKIKTLFPHSSLSCNPNRLVWRATISPSPLSNTYEIELIYVRNKQPDVYVLSPKLLFFPGKSSLPHVYSTEEQRLCLYYRRASEWRKDMFLADTIIPWTSEWLLHYECWLATGIWHGGGIHNVAEIEKLKDQEINGKG